MTYHTQVYHNARSTRKRRDIGQSGDKGCMRAESRRQADFGASYRMGTNRRAVVH
jgi:hypothetical protein